VRPLLAILAILALVTGPVEAADVRDPLATEPQLRLKTLRDTMERYASLYDLDWTWIAGIAFQESGFNQAARGPGGHIGVMQIAPATAASAMVSLPAIYDADGNIHAGVRYLRSIIDITFDDPAINPADRVLFAIAAYQAGPMNILSAREWAVANGLDANRWYGGVEEAVRMKHGMHTVTYVRDVAAYRDALRNAFPEY
jgi:membrane-bound lytic murein transglycosylase MltF